MVAVILFITEWLSVDVDWSGNIVVYGFGVLTFGSR
jgi:hypothetical protein